VRVQPRVWMIWGTKPCRRQGRRQPEFTTRRDSESCPSVFTLTGYNMSTWKEQVESHPVIYAILIVIGTAVIVFPIGFTLSDWTRDARHDKDVQHVPAPVNSSQLNNAPAAIDSQETAVTSVILIDESVALLTENTNYLGNISPADMFNAIKDDYSARRAEEHAEELYLDRWIESPGWILTVASTPEKSFDNSWTLVTESSNSDIRVRITSTQENMARLRKGQIIRLQNGRVSHLSVGYDMSYMTITIEKPKIVVME